MDDKTFKAYGNIKPTYIFDKMNPNSGKSDNIPYMVIIPVLGVSVVIGVLLMAKMYKK